MARELFPMTDPAHLLTEVLPQMTCCPEPEPMGIVGWQALGPAGCTWASLFAGEGPLQVIREGGEVTVLAPWPVAEGLFQTQGGAQLEGPFTWIRFEAPMAWDLVGFLALVTGALAQAEIPLGAVCSFSRDHLFVPQERCEEALAVLADLGIGPG